MPSALDPGDRKLLLIAGTILVVLIAATVVLAPSSGDSDTEGFPTTYSTGRNGAQAAYLLLRKLGYPSERWEKSPVELPSDGAGKILILADPYYPPDKSEREALQQFARTGGCIIYIGQLPFFFVGTEPLSSPPLTIANPRMGKFPALAPSPLSRDAAEITMRATNRWVASDNAQVPVYGTASEPVVTTWRLSKGRMIWWSAPTPLTNSGISLEGNLAFFLDCIRAGRPSANPGETTVLWDEYFHGYGGSLWSYFAETPVPWAIFQLALAAVFAVFTFGRRSGPVYAPRPVSRLSPLEFVDTLGDLYRRADAGPAVVRVAYQRFRTQLLRRLALPNSISVVQLDAAVRERLAWRQPGLIDTLQRAEHASRASEFPAPDALKLVQALEHYEVLFGLKQRPVIESDSNFGRAASTARTR